MTGRTLKNSDIDEYRKYLLREEKSSATVEKYLRDVRAFFVFAKTNEVVKELAVSYKMMLEKVGYKPRSINSMIASLNCFFDYKGWGDCKIKNVRVQRQTYLSEDKELNKFEYIRLLNAAKSKQKLNLAIRTICGTGIRVSELKFFTVDGVKKGEISVKCKNKIRIIIIPRELRKLLLNYVKQNGIKSGVIFVTRNGKPLDRSYIWAQMKSLCKEAGVKPSKVFPHNLRKLFARTFYGIEKDIAKLADILGHSSIETTRIYIMSTGVEHRKNIEKMGLVLVGHI